jgi:hypothetical protein
MTRNLGSTDRTVRIVLGIVLLLVGIFTGVAVSWLWDVIGVIALATGIAGYCPLYTLFHVNTMKHSQP